MSLGVPSDQALAAFLYRGFDLLNRVRIKETGELEQVLPRFSFGAELCQFLGILEDATSLFQR